VDISGFYVVLSAPQPASARALSWFAQNLSGESGGGDVQPSSGLSLGGPASVASPKENSRHAGCL